MTSYESLLQRCFTGSILCEETPSVLPDEITLQSQWFAGQFGRDFIDTEGRTIRIVQFGHWNRAAGPDFLECAVEIDGALKKGPIELDIQALDWEHHGHSENPDFDAVILHIAFCAPSNTYYTRSLSGTSIPRVIVPQERIFAALAAPRFSTANAHIGRCATPLEQMPGEHVQTLLKEAALHRARTKAARLNASIDAHGWNATLWQAIATVLGYRHNQLSFTLLTQRLPLQTLRDEKEKAEALLFGAAGFLESGLVDSAPENSRIYLRDLWETWWRLRDQHEPSPERAIAWKLGGIRPVNHPQRRVGALCTLIPQWHSLSHAIRTTDFRGLEKKLCALEHPFWNHHHTLKSKRTEKPMALIGASRARDFIINVVVPLRLDQSPLTWDSYAALPASTSNEKIDKALIRLFGKREDASSFQKKAWQQQALLQIYSDFCLNDASECEKCTFPEQLRQWNG